jgi:ABC-type ATPase involved in cell division
MPLVAPPEGRQGDDQRKDAAPATVRTPMLLGNDEPGGPARE